MTGWMLETEKSRITVFFFDIDILLAGSQLHSVTTQCALQRPSRLFTRCCWLPPTRTCCRRPRWSRPDVVGWPPGSTPKRWRRRQCRLRCGTRSSSGVMCGSSVYGAEGLAGMRHRALASVLVCIYLPLPCARAHLWMCSHFLTLCGNLYTFTALGLDLVGQHRGTCGGGGGRSLSFPVSSFFKFYYTDGTDVPSSLPSLFPCFFPQDYR